MGIEGSSWAEVALGATGGEESRLDKVWAMSEHGVHLTKLRHRISAREYLGASS